MSFKVTISDKISGKCSVGVTSEEGSGSAGSKVNFNGATLAKSVQSVTFIANPPYDIYDRHTTEISSMSITGKIGAEDSTVDLYKWALLPTTDPKCYRKIEVEQSNAAGQVVRKVSFPNAFVVDYSESYSKDTGVGVFTLFVRQLDIDEDENDAQEERSTTEYGVAGVGAGEVKKASGDIKVKKVIAPQNGKVVEVFTNGEVQVPRGKVEAYIRGKVNVDIEAVRRQYKELQNLKQTKRKLFDSDPNNQKLLESCKSQIHNYERSVEMSKSLEKIGLSDTVKNNRKIAEHILEVGKKVDADNRLDVKSILEGPNGKVKLLTTWKILEDETPYLSTIKVIPI